MEIVAVGMRDVAAFGVDCFYVRFGPDEVHSFDVFRSGQVVQLEEEPLPERHVTAAIEKWNACFRVVPPVTVQSTAELPMYLGQFEVVNETTVRPKVG